MLQLVPTNLALTQLCGSARMMTFNRKRISKLVVQNTLKCHHGRDAVKPKEHEKDE
jgi:hypothetical protein